MGLIARVKLCRTPIGATPVCVNGILATWSARINLERRFALWLFASLGLLCLTYLVLDAPSSSVLLAIMLTLGVGAIASAVAHYALFGPIRRLAVMARAIGAGDFSKRLGIARNDDIGSLALEMDLMCDQLEAAQLASEAHIAALEQLRHSDRIATLGRLASSVAHELGNPLNVIELRAQLVASGEADTLARAQQNAVVIIEQTRRMTSIIDEILSFARMHPAKIARLDLVRVLHKAIVLSEHTSKKHKSNITLDTHASTLEIDGDADKLLQVIVNLIVNGIQAMPGGGTLRVSTCETQIPPIHDPTGSPRDYVCIEIADQGVGISADAMAKVFEPFFSTKSADGGTGLGLSVAQGIAREHDGWITATSELKRGSTFRVYLPKRGVKISDHD